MDESKKDINSILLFELAVVNLNYMAICDYFGIPQKQRYNPNCGEWIIKWIKEHQEHLSTKRPDELFGTNSTPEIFVTEKVEEKTS